MTSPAQKFQTDKEEALVRLFMTATHGLSVTMKGVRYKAIFLQDCWRAGSYTPNIWTGSVLHKIETADNYNDAWRRVVDMLEADLEKPLN